MFSYFFLFRGSIFKSHNRNRRNDSMAQINSKMGWLVTDLLGRRVVSPYMENNRLLVANDDMGLKLLHFTLMP